MKYTLTGFGNIAKKQGLCLPNLDSYDYYIYKTTLSLLVNIVYLKMAKWNMK